MNPKLKARRTFLKTLTASSATGAFPMPESSAQQAVPNSSGTDVPRLKAPANAADCHIHIYDPRFQPRVDKPANGTVDDYRLVQKRLRGTPVVVVPTPDYRPDNSVTRAAIKQLGLANARGVAVLRPAVTDAELKDLDEAGIRGIRFTTANPQ